MAVGTTLASAQSYFCNDCGTLIEEKPDKHFRRTGFANHEVIEDLRKRISWRRGSIKF
jgi:hypothetical protein